jgi:hypothetical protein
MRNFNFTYPLGIIILAILLGFFMNYRNGLTWPENVQNMQSLDKIVTYLGLFIVIFVWKNWGNFKKS